MWRQFVTFHFLAVSKTRRVVAFDGLHPETVQRRWMSSIKITKQLKRMIDRSGGSKKKKIFPGPVNLRMNLSSEEAAISPLRKPVYTEGQKRRAHQVGHVLYDNIVHLVNSGELSDRLAAMSVEIVKVKVVPDFSVTNVYWLSSGTAQDEVVQTLFNENAGHLRHMLTSLHILGTIPRICFVRDDSHARYMAVDTLLRTADFGPDFVPTRLDSNIRNNLTSAGREEDRVCPEDQLQRSFNHLNITAATDDTFQQAAVNMQEKKQGLLETITLGEKQRCQETDSAHKPGFHETANVPSVCRGWDVQSESVKQDSTGSRGAYSSESVGAYLSLETHSPHMEKSRQDARMSLHTHHTLIQLQEKARESQKPTAPTVENRAAVLEKMFRDDMCKVPHSQLLSKVMLKKQKAGVRPNSQELTSELEIAIPKAEPANLKYVLQKTVKSKGRLKRQSDYDKRDMVLMNSQDVYADDDYHHEEEFDEVNDDLCAEDEK